MFNRSQMFSNSPNGSENPFFWFCTYEMYYVTKPKKRLQRTVGMLIKKSQMYCSKI